MWELLIIIIINPIRPAINVNPIIYFYQLQYYGNVSLYLSKLLKKLFRQYFKDLKLIFAYRSICMHDFSVLRIEYQMFTFTSGI